MRRIACLSFCSLVLLCAHGQPAERDAKVPTGTKKASTAPASAAPATPIKAMYYHNIVTVFREVQASGLAGPKGEFESTAQYEARLASWKAKGATKKYVFAVEQGEDNYTFNYDADAEEMALTVGNEYLVSNTIPLRVIRTVLGTYVGTNVFGVKKIITRMVEDTYSAELSRSSPFQLFSKGEYGILAPAMFSWKMNSAAASANKAYLRIAVVGTIPSPEATEEQGLREPTIDHPRQSLLHSRTIPFSLEELRVLDSRTGATVASFPPQQDPLVKSGPSSNGSVFRGGTTSGSSAGGLYRDPLLAPTEGGGIIGGPFPAVGASAPLVLHKVEPEYSEEARKAKYQGTVVLYVEVDPSGRPADIRVVRSLGLGLDEKAVEAVKQWRFKPGYEGGTPVTLGIMIEVPFRLL